METLRRQYNMLMFFFLFYYYYNCSNGTDKTYQHSYHSHHYIYHGRNNNTIPNIYILRIFLYTPLLLINNDLFIKMSQKDSSEDDILMIVAYGKNQKTTNYNNLYINCYRYIKYKKEMYLPQHVIVISL